MMPPSKLKEELVTHIHENMGLVLALQKYRAESRFGYKSIYFSLHIFFYFFIPTFKKINWDDTG